MTEENKDIAPIPLSKYALRIAKSININPELSNVWVTAEITDFVIRGGHCYMQLIEKDDNSPSKPMTAKLRANIWRHAVAEVYEGFQRFGGTDIVNGIKVNLRGSASHHAVYGLSFNVLEMRPFMDEGEREKKRREILEKLKKEEIIYHNRQHIITPDPQRIAVISSDSAAGYRDFITHLTGNSYKFVFYPCLFNSLMQGEKTAGSVINALKRIEKNYKEWDCVVIIRGGGATVDMDGFDDYELARTVCEFPLPVIVGIGHEKDRNVLDEIANVSCKTPTAVADFLVERLASAWNVTGQLVNRIIQEATDRIHGEKLRLSQLETRLPAIVDQKIEREKSRISQIASNIPLTIGTITSREKSRLDSALTMLKTTLQNIMTRQQDRLSKNEQMLSVLSPSNTLKRGYAIARKDGKALRSTKELSEGDSINVELFDGEIKAKI